MLGRARDSFSRALAFVGQGIDIHGPAKGPAGAGPRGDPYGFEATTADGLTVPQSEFSWASLSISP